MAGSGKPAITIMEDTAKEKKEGYILVVEGPPSTSANGLFCTVGEKGERRVTVVERLVELAKGASAVVCIGQCTCFGGIPDAHPNPGGYKGVSEVLKAERIPTPVINIPGCPAHPDWFIGTVASILLYGLPKPEELDDYLRPKAYFGKLVHENCERRSYFDEGKFAKKFGDEGCLWELGCKGPVTYCHCPDSWWNSRSNWCVRAGNPCCGCTQPEFPDRFAPLYERLLDQRLPNVAQKGEE